MWLKRMMDHERCKKQSSKVEIVDAHSTENCESRGVRLIDELVETEQVPEASGENKKEIDKCLSNHPVDICPVSTTVSITEDISPGHGIFWYDANLFQNTDYYERDFGVDSGFRDESADKRSLDVTPGVPIKNNNEKVIDEGEYSITSNYCVDEYENISIMESIFNDDMNDQRILDRVSPPTIKRNTTNWNYLFDYHLANIDSTGDSVLSSVQLVDPQLVTRNGKHKKQGYMSSLGLKNSRGLDDGKISPQRLLDITEKPFDVAKNEQYNTRDSQSRQDSTKDTLVSQDLFVLDASDSTLSNVSSTTSSCVTHSQSCLPSVSLRQITHVTSERFNAPRSSLSSSSSSFDEPGAKKIRISPLKIGDNRKMPLFEGMRIIFRKALRCCLFELPVFLFDNG